MDTNDDESRLGLHSTEILNGAASSSGGGGGANSRRGSFASTSARLTGDGLASLNRIKETLPENAQPWFWQGLWFLSSVVMIGLAIGFRSKIFEFLDMIATMIRNLGPWGPPVIMISLFAASFPPVIGYSSIITMSGYVFGFLYGFIIAFSAAWMGAMVCFYLCRRWFKARVRKLMVKNKSLRSVVRTVEKKGFRLLVLIRLAPYPYNIMNALLSATHIPFPSFAIATGLSLFKLTLHVYIGSTLSSLAGGGDNNDGDNPKDPKAEHGQKLKIFVMVFSILLGIGVGVYVWLVASREVEKAEATRIERRQRRRQENSRRAMNRRLGLDSDTGNETGNGNGIELSEQIHGSEFTGGRGDEESQSLIDRLEFGEGRRHIGTDDILSESEEEEDFSDDEDDHENHDGDWGGYRSVGQHEGQGEQDREEEMDIATYPSEVFQSPWQLDDDDDDDDNHGITHNNGEDNRGLETLLPTTDRPSVDNNMDGGSH